MDQDAVVRDYRSQALDALKRASELFVIADATGRDEDLQQAMLAAENAAGQARHYFYVRSEAAVAALVGPTHRLRLPQANRIA